MNEQDAMWEVFDKMVPEVNWIPTEHEKWLIGKIAQALKDIAREPCGHY